MRLKRQALTPCIRSSHASRAPEIVTSQKDHAISTVRFEFPSLSGLDTLSGSVCVNLDFRMPILLLLNVNHRSILYPGSSFRSECHGVGQFPDY